MPSSKVSAARKAKEVAASALISSSITASLFCINMVDQSAEAHAYGSFHKCWGSTHVGVTDGTPTTCSFAENVRLAVLAHPGVSPVAAYSPITNSIYLMDCYDANVYIDGDLYWGTVCNGGIDAEVVVW